MCSIAEGYATWVAFVKDNNNRLNGMAPKGTTVKRLTQKSFCKENNPCQSIFLTGVVGSKSGLLGHPLCFISKGLF